MIWKMRKSTCLVHLLSYNLEQGSNPPSDTGRERAIFHDDYISKGWLPGPAESQESKFWQEALKRFPSQTDRGRICKFSKVLLLMPKIWPPCTGAKSNLRDELRVKQTRSAFLLCQAKGDTMDSCPSKPCVPAWCDLVKSFIAVIQVWIC